MPRTARVASDAAVRALAGADPGKTGGPRRVVVFNPLSHDRDDVVDLPEGIGVPEGLVARDPPGHEVALQALPDGRALLRARVPSSATRDTTSSKPPAL